ncbi:hypothetical protein [Lacipirellula sp.]|uniref:hypothetical protein n=1 Tax=Lacipirellula sp. TaxID=2691419 RepID=UPI003D124A79
MANKPGAPKKPPEELRGDPIQIRLTRSERQACEDAAAQSALKLTVWARNALIIAASNIKER